MDTSGEGHDVGPGDKGPNSAAEKGSLDGKGNWYRLEDKKDELQSPHAPDIALDNIPVAEVPVHGYDGSRYSVVNKESLEIQRPDVTTQVNQNDSPISAPSPPDGFKETDHLKAEQLPAYSGSNEYFAPETALSTEMDDNSRVTSTSTLASSAFSFVSSQRNTTSAPQSPQGQPGTPGQPPTPSSNVAIPTGKPPRPTSVPIVTSISSSPRRRREGPEYPRYPDQSFAALQSQHYSSYQPHPLRTRSSHASQNSSFSSIPSRNSRDQIAMVTGAKTVGNTPAQSPGLFSPVYPASRNKVDESEDSQTSTPLMHPAHMQTPKETHNLSKDVDPSTGHKTLNEYEILYKLGAGQHGTVKLGRNLDTGEFVAVKIVRRNARKRRLRRMDDPADMIKREIAVLKKARHPHVVSLLEVIDDVQFGKVYLVLEFVELGEIVWRKMTDKNIATFEMNRIKRELDGTSDPGIENAEVDRFNGTVMHRRRQKAQAFAERNPLAGHGAEDREAGKPTSAASEGPFWSLEYGGELEDDDAAQQSSFRSGLGLGVAASMAHDESSLGTSIHDLPLNESPETPKPKPVFDRDMLAPDSRPPSSPLPLGNFPETMFGPYTAEGQSTDSLLQTFLNHSLTEEHVEEDDWTAQERLYMHVPCLTISQALDVFRDTVLGLEFLHYQGIIHRDIKPANLLWTGDHRIKISDFGVSYLGKVIKTQAKDDEVSSPDAADLQEALELAKTVGTPAFYAPELCSPDIFGADSKTPRPLITGQIDVWALGVTLYGMIFGQLPFFDTNEFVMYEKIAQDALFIPRRRLKGVEDKPKAHMNSNKRFDDILEYEDVDDELRDLLTRLLDKDPLKRITIKEVKHHPWVLRGIQNQPAWIDETDPNLQSEGRKIEISNEDVQEAVIPVTIVDRIKSSIGSLRRFGTSMHRGRNRKRADSDGKELQGADLAHPPKTNSEGPESRRTSLRGDEQIFSALRASRENSEHPLSQSVTASPELKADEDYFDDANALTKTSNRSSPHTKRPNPPMRSVSSISTAESMRTIRPAVPPLIKESSSSPTESFSTNTAIVDAPGPLSLGGIFGGSRRFINKIRSRERGRTRDNNPSAESSRSSSVSNEVAAPTFEDTRSSPSLAFSTAVAAGRVNPPPVLRDDNPTLALPSVNRPPSRRDSSVEAFQQAVDLNNRRRTLEHLEASAVPQMRHQANPFDANASCPPSPDDRTFPPLQSPIANIHADEALAFGISSSSDQLASTNISESFSHPSIPSVVSGASSLSGIVEPPGYPLAKAISPSTIIPRREDASADSLDDDPAELTPREDDVKAAPEDDEAGYNGEEEMDSDSDSGGLEMGGQRKELGPSASPSMM
ncbi:MAG: hypothetical protein Q9216_003595 [Gyalolechia sp. 2 TL-2023]